VNDELRRRLKSLTKSEQERRLEHLVEKLGICKPETLDLENPEPLDVSEYEEYVALKEILGFD
jgi:hypothetical protein